MKLKYYLRGIGIGVIITTIIFMISISIHKNDMESQNTSVQQKDSKTVAEYESDTQEVLNTEISETELSDTTTADAQQSVDVGTDAQQTANAQADIQSEQKADIAPETAATETVAPDATTPENATKEKVRFEIGGGEYSDVICRKLVEAGLVDDAEAFNKYLMEKDYDNLILPGVYDIPKDSTYEEIAILLTTKVEE